VVLYKMHKPRLKGLRHDKLGPPAATKLITKSQTDLRRKIQALIATSVERRAEGDNPRPASLSRAARPLTVSFQTGRLDLCAPCVQPSRGSYNRQVCSPQVEVTTAMHAWTALPTSQANHGLAYKLSNLSLAYKLSNPPWRPIKGSPTPHFSTHHLEKRRVQDVVPLSTIGRV
jgi:hypothetical protein